MEDNVFHIDTLYTFRIHSRYIQRYIGRRATDGYTHDTHRIRTYLRWYRNVSCTHLARIPPWPTAAVRYIVFQTSLDVSITYLGDILQRIPLRHSDTYPFLSLDCFCMSFERILGVFGYVSSTTYLFRLPQRISAVSCCILLHERSYPVRYAVSCVFQCVSLTSRGCAAGRLGGGGRKTSSVCILSVS